MSIAWINLCDTLAGNINAAFTLNITDFEDAVIAAMTSRTLMPLRGTFLLRLDTRLTESSPVYIVGLDNLRKILRE
jgi:hypothetical protein